MKLLVVGAGSTGGYFGGRLAEAGRDVTFLVREARAKQLQDRGLEIRSPRGDVVLHPKVVTAAEIDQTYDVILLAVKGFALEGAMADMAPAIGEGTIILPILNGMHHVDALSRRFGSAAVGGCVAKCATTLDSEGRVLQLNGMHEFAYGEMDGRSTDRLRELDKFVAGAGFDARQSADIAGEMWGKWLMLASMSAITCLMGGTVGEVAAAPGGEDFAETVIDEAGRIVGAVGRLPESKVVEGMRRMLTQRSSDQTSSMYRDMQSGHRIEVEEIIGDLVRKGREAGIDAPILGAAYTQLSVYANRRNAQ